MRSIATCILALGVGAVGWAATADAQTSTTFEIGAAFRECDDCPEMIVLPAGVFDMGSPDGELDRQDDEGPQRRVAIPAFALGVAEISVAEYRRFVEATGRAVDGGCVTYEDALWDLRIDRGWDDPGFEQSAAHPVVCVSAEDASAYVEWLNAQVDGAPYRLPTEAEQEYAIRAGAASTFPWGVDPDAGCAFANGADQTAAAAFANWTAAACEDGHSQTAPAAALAPNAFGLRHMSGNVWEWGADCLPDSDVVPPTDGSALLVGRCSHAVLRGGSWFDPPAGLRAADRRWLRRVIRRADVGFRVARTL